MTFPSQNLHVTVNAPIFNVSPASRLLPLFLLSKSRYKINFITMTAE